MKRSLTDNGHFKVEASVIPLWLCSFSLLLLMTPSVFLVIPLSIGTSLATLSILFPMKQIRVIRYVILFSLFFIEYLFPELRDLNLSLATLFLPPMFSFDTEEETPYLKFLLILLFGLLLFLSGMSLSFVFLLASLSLLAMSLTYLLLERSKLRESYDDYYYLSKSEKNELMSLYEELSVEQNSRIENAILNERNRLSRDIHDSLGHLTSRGILQIGAMLVTEKDEARKQALLGLKTTLSEGMNEVRRSLHGFQNESILLKEELEKIITGFSFCPVDFTFSSGSNFALKFKYSVIFIVQEALTNISRHSSATKASISFIEMEEKVYLKITDNGTASKIGTDGMGLYSIRKRAEELSGKAEFSVDKGFRIFITLEKNPHKL